MTELLNTSLDLARFKRTNPVSYTKSWVTVAQKVPPEEDSFLYYVASQNENLKLHVSACLSGLWS